MSSTAFPLVRRIAADVFGLDEQAIVPESSPDTIERWDSIQHLNLVLAIEERFGIQLTPEEMDDMRTIGRAAEIVERRVQVGAQ